MSTKLDMNAHYRVKRWPGVAVYVHGWPQVWEPAQYYAHVDQHGELCGERDSKGRFAREVLIDDETEGEFVDDIGDNVIVVMVGDDAKHTVDVSDLELLGPLEFCRDCGQIGCQCNVYE